MKSALVTTIILLAAYPLFAGDLQWPMHTIDASSRGADGVRLGDVDKDGLTDIVTGWEEGGQIRICFQPPLSQVKKPWPSITAGRVKSPEDAVFVDVNKDGWLDVVSCCEGKEQAVYLHLNPGSAPSVRFAKQWTTKLLPNSKNVTRWMFCEPLTDGRLVFGSKEPNAQIALWDDRKSGNRFSKLRTSGWLMSLRRMDCNADGLDDIVYSDRKGVHRSVGWLQNPGERNGVWADHFVGGKNVEVMFLDADQSTIACNVKGGPVLLMAPTNDPSAPWKTRQIAHTGNTGSGKGVAIADVNGDGRMDLVCTCEHSERKIGVFWLEAPDAPAAPSNHVENWQLHDISGDARGVKFDRIEMLDLDGDGDLDLLTCEERANLGVIWYENQHISQ